MSAPPERSTGGRDRGRLLVGAAACAVAVLFGLFARGAPSVQDVAAAAGGPPERAASGALGPWQATGARTDEVEGRRVRTVVYRLAGATARVSTVDGGALHLPDRTVVRGDGVFATARGLVAYNDGGTVVVTGTGDLVGLALLSRRA